MPPSPMAMAFEFWKAHSRLGGAIKCLSNAYVTICTDIRNKGRSLSNAALRISRWFRDHLLRCRHPWPRPMVLRHPTGSSCNLPGFCTAFHAKAPKLPHRVERLHSSCPTRWRLPHFVQSMPYWSTIGSYCEWLPVPACDGFFCIFLSGFCPCQCSSYKLSISSHWLL